MQSLAFRITHLLALACVLSIAGEARSQGAQKRASRVAAPTIWANPGSVERLDFAGGSGGPRTPKPPFTFIEEDTSGSNPKIKVRDATGRNWTAKWGSEVHAEI